MSGDSKGFSVEELKLISREFRRIMDVVSEVMYSLAEKGIIVECTFNIRDAKLTVECLKSKS